MSGAGAGAEADTKVSPRCPTAPSPTGSPTQVLTCWFDHIGLAGAAVEAFVCCLLHLLLGEEAVTRRVQPAAGSREQSHTSATPQTPTEQLPPLGCFGTGTLPHAQQPQGVENLRDEVHEMSCNARSAGHPRVAPKQTHGTPVPTATNGAETHPRPPPRIHVLRGSPITVAALDEQVILHVLLPAEGADDEAGAGRAVRVVILPLTVEARGSRSALHAAHTPGGKGQGVQHQPLAALPVLPPPLPQGPLKHHLHFHPPLGTVCSGGSRQ